MFLQNLLKKLSELFTVKNLQELLIHGFRQIVMIIIAIGLFVILLIIFIITSKPKQYVRSDNETTQVTLNKDDVSFEMLISPNDLIIPTLNNFDITNDFIQFTPKKSFQIPDIDKVVKDYDKILNDTIDESCKFNFEKRFESKGRAR